MKKIFLFIAAALISVGMFAESGTCGDNVTWDLTAGVLTISGTGAMADYNFSSRAPWNEQRETIITVVVNNGVTTIGDWAFYDCKNLSSVTIPSSVTSIKDLAFNGCKALTSITIPNGVESIGQSAFSESGLISIALPASINQIHFYAFYKCYSLTAMTVDAGNTKFSDIDGVLFNKSKTELIQYPSGKQGEYVVPDGVTTIENYAFYRRTELTSVTIPSSVTKINSCAFAYCSGLTSITCKAGSVPTLGSDVFKNATNLAHIYVPKESVDDYKGATGWIDYASIIEAISGGTGIETVSVQTSAVRSQKVIRDGQLLILRDGKTFNLTGAEVR